MPDQSSRQKAEDHYYAALDFFSDGEHESALEEYRKSIEADPTFTEAMHGMARALQDLDRLDEAIEVARQLKPKRTVFTHIAHDLAHEATNRTLPAGMELGYDGQRIPLT